MKYNLVLLIFIKISFAAIIPESSDLFQLINNDGWILVTEYNDGIRLYEKNIKNLSVKAYRVEKTTNQDYYELYEAFENIKDYSSVLKSAKNIHFDFISENQDTLIGYQYLQIPLINDRHYTYRLIKSSSKRPYSSWTLIDSDIPISAGRRQNGDTPVILTKGSGLYQVIRNGNQQVAQYNLFLDPAGRIPSFLTNIANRQGLVNMFRDLLNHSELTK